jgi:hypothetical protein
MQQETTFFDDAKVRIICVRCYAAAAACRCARRHASSTAHTQNSASSGTEGAVLFLNQVHGVTAILDNDIRTLQISVTEKLPASVGHLIRYYIAA